MRLVSHLSTFAAVSCGLLLGAASVRADVFDWNNITYAPSAAAAATNSAAFASANGTNTLQVKFTLQNSATFVPAGTDANNRPYQFPISASSSQSSNYQSGGGSDTQKALQIGANFSGNTATVSQSFLITLLFAQPVVSASFSFFDVDSNGSGSTTFYTDRISAIQGSVNGGTAVIPSVTNTGSTTNTVSGNVVTANGGNSAATSSGGNAQVTFNSTTPVNQITFVYGDAYTAANHATGQLIALSNVTFTNAVPEPGTLAMVGLGAAGVAGIAFRRRR